jgi:DNA invertase Pin-like site-specific DNA recombinase
MEKLYIAYYRVSTREQGISGLGLESQKSIVLNYILHNGNRIVAEFTEIESGKNNNRPELIKAINLCKEQNGTLVIAKLDRLSRNVNFISALMESKVNFICCDMPDASPLTIHIFAALAQWERERISERTKSALQAKKVKDPDWIPGTPANLTNEAILKAHASTSNKARTDQAVRFAYHFIKPLKESGMSYQGISNELNSEGYLTRQGKPFHAMQVFNIWKRFEN